jgi:hypothetical protein
LAYSHSRNKASLIILRLVYVAVCLEMINRRFERSGAVENIALITGRNTKSNAETVLISMSVSASPWHS